MFQAGYGGYGQGGYGRQPQQQDDGMGKAAMGAGLMALLCCCCMPTLDIDC